MSADISTSSISSTGGAHRRRLARRPRYTVIMAGAPGTGKSALADALAGVRLGDRQRRTRETLVYSAGKPNGLKITQHQIEGPNAELECTLLDVHNLGTSTDCMTDIERLTQYLEDRFNEMVAEQSRIRRNPKFVDKRVHACIYLIDSFHGLRELDITAMTRLSTLTNVIPVIGRAESFMAEELKEIKAKVLQDCAAYKIPIFDFVECDVPQPLHVVRTNEYDKSGNAMLSLKLPFGRVDATDPQVSNFVLLRTFVLDMYSYELIDNTVDILYEQYRTIRLSNPDARYSVLEPEALANHASRIKQEQLERESRELKEQEERVQAELEQRRRDLQDRERELRKLEEQLRLEREIADRRTRRLSDIDENTAVSTPLQQQREFNSGSSTPTGTHTTLSTTPGAEAAPAMPPAALPAAPSKGAPKTPPPAVPALLPKSAAANVEPQVPPIPAFKDLDNPSRPPNELRYAGSVHISPVQGNGMLAGEAGARESFASLASSEYANYDDVVPAGKSLEPLRPAPPVPHAAPLAKDPAATKAPPVPTTKPPLNGARLNGSAKTGPVIGERSTSSAKTGPVLRKVVPKSANAPPMQAPSPPTQAPAPASASKPKASVMPPPPSPPSLHAQKSFVASPRIKSPAAFDGKPTHSIYDSETGQSRASLVTAPDLNPSVSSLDSMPGAFPGVVRDSGVRDSGPNNNSGSSIESSQDSPSYPPRSPRRPNSFIALDQTLIQPLGSGRLSSNGNAVVSPSID